MIRAAGFNGTVVTTWADACSTKIAGRSNAGKPSSAMCDKSRNIANRETFFAGDGSDRRSYTGLTTAAKYDGRFTAYPLYSAATVRARDVRLFQRAITASIATTAKPATSTCQPGLMPASKSKIEPRMSIGDT
jgi:hypothetical protein